MIASRVRTAATLLGVVALLTGACTIEQDLTPVVADDGTGSPTPDPSPGSEQPTDDPSEDPSADPSEDPSTDPTEDPTEDVSPDPDNRAPTAAADSARTAEDAAVTIAVLGNDTDPDGDRLRVAVADAPARGSASVLSDGRVRYVPRANVDGSDRFTYRVRDGRGGADVAAVTVTITPVNDAPQAVDDRATTPEDAAITLDVRANDVDVDGDDLTIQSVGDPQRGQARVEGNRIVYDPEPNVIGEDRFTYTIRDPSGVTDSALVTVDVGGRNDPPRAVDDTVRTDEDTPVTIDVVGNDTDPDGDSLSVRSVSPGTRGTPAISGGRVVYTPNANATGTDTFTYVVEDTSGATDSGTVTVTITPVNDPPNARGDSATTREDTAVTIDVLANDADPEGDPLTVTAVTQPSRGRASVQGGKVLYEPNANYRGSDSFTYTIEDGRGGADTATVAVTVTSVNDAPTARADGPFLVQLGNAVTMRDLLDNDRDADGDSLVIEIVSQPAHGSLQQFDGTTIRYVNNGDSAYTSDSFTYRAKDPSGATSGPATVSFDINRPPNATNDNANFGETDFNVLTGFRTDGGPDSDPDGDAFSLVSHTQPSGNNGSVSCNAQGNCVWNPPPFSCGASYTAQFTYSIRDARGGVDTATAKATTTYIC